MRIKVIVLIITALSFLLISCQIGHIGDSSGLSRKQKENNFRNAYDYERKAYSFFAADTVENPQNTDLSVISSKTYNRGKSLNIREYEVSLNNKANRDIPPVFMMDIIVETALLIAAEMTIQEGYDSFILTDLYEAALAMNLNRPYYTNVNLRGSGATATTYGGPYTSYYRVIHFSFLAFNKSEVDFTKSIVLKSYSYPVEDNLPAESGLYRTQKKMKEINEGITKLYAAGEHFDTSYAYKAYYDARDMVSRISRHIPWTYNIRQEEPLVRKESVSSYKKYF